MVKYSWAGALCVFLFLSGAIGTLIIGADEPKANWIVAPRVPIEERLNAMEKEAVSRHEQIIDLLQPKGTPPISPWNVIQTMRSEFNRIRNDMKEILSCDPTYPVVCFSDTIIRVSVRRSEDCEGGPVGGTVLSDDCRVEIMGDGGIPGRTWTPYLRVKMHAPTTAR